MKIAVIKLSALGDLVLASGGIRGVRNHFKGDEIIFVTSPLGRELFKNSNWFNSLFIYDSKNKSLSHLFKAAAELRKFKFDIAIDFQSSSRSRWLTLFLNSKVKIGYGLKFFYKDGVAPSNIKLSEIEIVKEILAKAGIDSNEAYNLELPTDLRELYNISNLLKGSSSYVIFHPGSSEKWKTKRWAEENFSILGDKLSDKGFDIVIIGGKEERKIAENISKGMKNPPLILSGKTDLTQLTIIIKNGKAMISTDSGPMHIAAAVGTPVVGLFGATNPALSAPPVGKVKIISKQLDCQPCNKAECDDVRCMNLITPDEVYKTLEDLLVENK